MYPFNPHHAPIGNVVVPVTSSVLTSASAKLSGQGPFRFLYVNTSTTFSITFLDDSTCSFNDVAKGTFFWAQGEFIHSIATATALFVFK